MWGAIISNGQNGGGGGSDFPFDLAYAKTRRWRINEQAILPQGALIVSVLNTSGLNDATVEVSGGSPELLGPGMQYNFEAQHNTVNKTLEVSKQITITPASGEFLEVFIAYPSSSAIDPNTI